MGFIDFAKGALGTVSNVARVIPGVGTAVGAVSGGISSLLPGSVGAPAPGTPGEAAYYGVTQAYWDFIGPGSRGHIRAGDEIGQANLAQWQRRLAGVRAGVIKPGESLANDLAIQAVREAGQLPSVSAIPGAANSGGLSLAGFSLGGLPSWVLPVAIVGGLVFLLWRK